MRLLVVSARFPVPNGKGDQTRLFVLLRELAKRDSIVSISGVVVLPDSQLPGLETAFIQSLEQAKTAEEYGRAIDRIERFATGRIFTRVRRAFERFTDEGYRKIGDRRSGDRKTTRAPATPKRRGRQLTADSYFARSPDHPINHPITRSPDRRLAVTPP